MPSNLCNPLLLPPSIFPSIRVFSNESALRIRWPKYWSFSLNISPSNKYSGLISFRMNWFDLLAVQWTLKSLFQHHSWKASILWPSAFFIVLLSHPYMPNGKTIYLWLVRTSSAKQCLCYLICCLDWSQLFFQEASIFWLMAAVTICSDFGTPKNKVCHCFHCFPIYLPWSDETRCHDLRFLNVEF